MCVHITLNFKIKIKGGLMISESVTLVMLYLSYCCLQLISMIYSGGIVIFGTIFLSKELSNSAKSVCNLLLSQYLYCSS